MYSTHFQCIKDVTDGLFSHLTNPAIRKVQEADFTIKLALSSAILSSGFTGSSNGALQPHSFVQCVFAAPQCKDKDVVTGMLVTKTLERNVHIKVQVT